MSQDRIARRQDMRLALNISRYVDLYFAYVEKERNVTKQWQYMCKLNVLFKNWLRKKYEKTVYIERKDLFFIRLTDLMDLSLRHEAEEIEQFKTSGD